MKGVLFDLPHVVEAATPNFRAPGLDERANRRRQLLRSRFPSGGDVYLLRHIIHDWYDEQSTQILSNCRRAMQPDARLLVVESVILPGNEPSVGKMLDLVMMVLPGGMERTEEQYRDAIRRRRVEARTNRADRGRRERDRGAGGVRQKIVLIIEHDVDQNQAAGVGEDLVRLSSRCFTPCVEMGTAAGQALLSSGILCR